MVMFSLLASFALVSACSRPDPWKLEDPTEALKVYLQALELGATEVAWEFLLPEDQAVLEARRDAFAELSGGAVTKEPWDFLSPGHVVSSAREYASVKVVEEASDDAQTVVEVILHDERSFQITMVQKDGRWYVDLPLEQLVPASQEHSRQRGETAQRAQRANAQVAIHAMDQGATPISKHRTAALPKDPVEGGYDE